MTNITQLNPDYDEIGLIAHISTLTEDVLTSNDLESLSKILYHSMKDTFKNKCGLYIKILEEIEDKNYLNLLDSKKSTFKINIRDKWLVQVILLHSIKHLLTSHKDIEANEFFHIIITHIIHCISIVKRNSVYLLRTLLLILNKCDGVLTSPLSLLILKCMDKIALSALSYFKQYAHNISKVVLSNLSQEPRFLFNIELLPVRGVDTFDVVNLFPQIFIRQNINKIVHKILKLFLNNVENKDGGTLYKSVLFYSFNEWKSDIWPLFLSTLKSVEYDSEFFQSLLKYWIPSNVTSYRSEFYTFLSTEQIDNKIKVYVLLETKKRGFATNIDFKTHILPILYDAEMSNVGLKIMSTYSKKSLCPEMPENLAVLNYLYSNLNTALEEDEVKSLYLLFSQIFLHAHADLRKNKKNLPLYSSFIENIYQYCCVCLPTDNFEVAAQILLILWNISTGSYKRLKLHYKVENKDMYAEGENLLYTELLAKNMWKLESTEFYEKLKNSFVEHKNGFHLFKLLSIYANKVNIITMDILKNIVNYENATTLENTDKIKSYLEILMKTNNCKEDNLKFLKDVGTNLSNNLNLIKERFCDQNVLYKNVVFFEIILIATKNDCEIKELHNVIEKALDLIGHILENNLSKNGDYKTLKILEAFINVIMNCIIQNKNVLWPRINKHKVITNLIKIIQKSNMKRPVSLAIEVLKHFGSKMEETDVDKVLKLQVLDATLKALFQIPTKQNMKIRRSPESRLVIHALCSSETSENKALLKWALNFLLDVLGDSVSSDTSISSALHSVEILVSDSTLQSYTLPYISSIFVSCVELFSRPSWIVRNADLQLAKALIERFYGVSLSINDRPKNIEDLFLLFPELLRYFFKILTLPKLDDRSILVFQFFFESQAREHIFEHEITRASRNCFLAILVDIIKKYPNDYGTLAVRSFVSLTVPKKIAECVADLSDHLKKNFKLMPKNIFANFAFLLQELHEKYLKSFENSISKNGIIKINLAVNSLLEHLRGFDTSLFDFLLVKVKLVNSILKEIEILSNDDFLAYEKRIFLHDNLPFVLVNAKSNHVSDILRKLLSNRIPNCLQVKILSILVARLESNEFNNENISSVAETLFEKSVLVEDDNSYLLQCYFKTLMVLCEQIDCINISKVPVSYNLTNNLYKVMIYVLYFSKIKNHPNVSQENFYKLVQKKYINSLGSNEEVDSDILSTLIYLKEGAPKKMYGTIFKLAFYGAIHVGIHLEAYNFICQITGKCYGSILGALNDFLSFKTLISELESEEVVNIFLLDINKFVESIPENSEDNTGYYSVESEYIVPKMFLKRLLKFCEDNR